MKLQQGPLDGAQERSYVIGQLIHFGVGVRAIDELWFELTDEAGDIEVLPIDDPVLSRMIIHLWRRFGALHGMLPTDFIDPKTVH